MKNILIQETDFNKIRKRIKESQDKRIIFSGENDELNRKVIEKEKIDVLLLNQKERKDKLKQRNSGFNQVLAKIAKKKKIILGINFDEIIESKGKKKSEILSRIKQNIKLCNKNKVQMDYIILKEKNKRNIYDLKALGSVLGMPTWINSKIGKFF